MRLRVRSHCVSGALVMRCVGEHRRLPASAASTVVCRRLVMLYIQSRSRVSVAVVTHGSRVCVRECVAPGRRRSRVCFRVWKLKTVCVQDTNKFNK